MDDRRNSTARDNRQAQARLPVQLTTFVGRLAERCEIGRLLVDSRLLTLTGPGGVGKTRLALAVAAECVSEYPAGVRLIELAALADDALVAQPVAAALGVQEDPSQPIWATLAAVLGNTRLLLILDNCEHLVDACAELADRLLRACPALSILATSREPLGIPGETLWPVLPLPVPDPRVVMGTDEIAASASVSLFVDRARLVQPTFALGDRNAQVVAEICRRLDGIPLAIELAAARLRSLGVVEIAERLDDRFRLLTTDLRTIVPRQQTLRATVDWSYGLLDEPERRMLRALAVFSGSFTLDAIEGFGFQDVGVADISAAERLGFGEVGSIHTASPSQAQGKLREPDPEAGGPLADARGTESCSPPKTQAPKTDTIDILAHLVDRSLVIADHQHGRARYRMLETIRQYGLEKLRESGEETSFRARHCDWYLALAAQAGPALRGPDQAAWVERLELEHDNIRAALGWAVEAGDAERGLSMAGALWRFWSYRGYLIEGRRWLDAVLALAHTTTTSAVLAEVLFAAGRLTHQQGEYAAAHRLFQASLTMAERHQYDEGIVGALTQLGHLALNQEQYDVARDQYSKALAHRHLVGDSGEVVVALASLAFVGHLQGQYNGCRELYEEGLAIAARLGDESLRGYLLCRLGELAVDQGQYDDARVRFTAGVEIYRMLGARTRLAGVLEGFAVLAAAHGEATRALRLAGAAAALRDLVMARATPREAAWSRSGLERARQQLGPRASEWTWSDGLALTLDQAIDEALAAYDHGPCATRADRLAERRTQSPPGDTEARPPGTMPFPRLLDEAPVEPLTERQREVAALVARGLTNRQIGEALVIAEGTANLHVKHILRKLGFATRAQIATWATRQGVATPLAIVAEGR